jgi:glutamate racemase
MIGVFDSGLGGLSVLAAIANALPRADLIYLADTAHVPYGEKTDRFITGRVLAIGRHLADLGSKLLVVACNTATTAAIQALREQMAHTHPGVSVVGVEPGVKPAAQSSTTGHIAVLATESTARSQRLAHLIRTHAEGVRVDIVPCPGWATHVETVQPDTTAFRGEVESTIAPLVASGADRLVLGCTHYSFLTPLIEPHLNRSAKLVDVSEAVARQVLRLYDNPYAGHAHLCLQATAHPERLRAALPALGLHALASRASTPELISL